VKTLDDNGLGEPGGPRRDAATDAVGVRQ